MMYDGLEVPVRIGETVTIGGREVLALREFGLRSAGNGIFAVTLTLLTENLDLDWHEIDPGVEFIARDEILTQLGKPEPEVEA